MSERVSRAALDALAEAVSGLLPEGVRVSAYESDGRANLDLCYDRGGDWVPSRTLRAGTKPEMAEYLRAMREGILLAREGAQ